MILDFDQFASLAWCQFWQVTLVAILVGAGVFFLCRRRSHLAHVLWLLVILKCLTPPVLCSPTGVFCWVPSKDSVSTAVDPKQIAVGQAPLFPVSDQLGVLPPSEAGSFEQVKPAVESSNVTWSEVPIFHRLSRWLFLIWAIGVILYWGVTFIAGLWWLRRLGRSGVEVDPRLISRISDLSQQLGIRRRVRVRVTREMIGPAVYGVIRPTLVMPEVLLSEINTGSIESVLAHELIHVRRWDGVVCLMQWIVGALWWFHPLVWWVNRRLNCHRERCCDEEVLASLACRPADYAQSLLGLLRLKHTLRPRLVFAGTHSKEVMMRRLENIMDQTGHFSARTPKWCWGVLAIGMLMVLPGASLKKLEAPVSSELVSNSSTAESVNKYTPPQPVKKASPKSKRKSTSRPEEKRPTTLPTPPAKLAEATGPIRPFDVLYIRAMGTLIDQPINGFYLVEPDGQVMLGPAYGRVDVASVSLEEANKRAKKQLETVLTKPFIKIKRKGRITRWYKADVTRSPYQVKIGDILRIRATNTLIDHPINGDYEVERDGTVDLFLYGDPMIKDQTFDEAGKTIEKVLKQTVVRPGVAVTMARWKIVECPLPKSPYRIAPGDLVQIDVLNVLIGKPINGTFVVEPGGTVELGPAYGRVRISGMTLAKAKQVIEAHLKHILARPQVAVAPAGWKMPLKALDKARSDAKSQQRP